MTTINQYFKIFIAFILPLLVSVFQLEAQDTYLKFDHITVNDGLPQNAVHSIIKDKYGFMWFGTWCGVCRYDGYSFKMFRANADDSTSFADNMINAMATDSFQNIWIKTGELSCLFRYNYESETFKRFPVEKIPPYIVDRIAKADAKKLRSAQNSRFIFSADSLGLKQYNKFSGLQTLHQFNFNDPFSLSDKSIYLLYIDNTENLWIGTRKGGVNHANLNIKAFSYFHADKLGKGLIDNEIRAIGKDNKGRLWIGSEDQGVTILERNAKGNKYSYLAKKRLIDNRIRAIYCDKHGFVWIGSKGGLDRYDPRTEICKHYTATPPGSSSNSNVFAITEDLEGTLWVGSFNGLARYDRINDCLVYLSASITGGLQIRAIMEDHQRNLWVASEDGGLTKLVHISASSLADEFKPFRYVHQEGNVNTLINNRTFSLSEDKAGMIWIGTNSGLSRLNPNNNTFKHFSIKNGFPDDMVMGTLFDGKESIWISHKKGLTRINTRTFELQSFNMYDGLQGNEFNQSTCYRDNTTGEMFFGGTNGLNSFFPDSIKTNQYKPRIVFTQLSVMSQILQPGTKVNSQVILKKSLLCTDEITLNWWNKTFSIEFAALHYANPLGNKYKYKLKGIDDQWIYTDGSKRIASYSHLPAGSYILTVYGANSDGVWSDNPATLGITILPPWWLTWWAITIYFAILCLIVWFVYNYILARIEFRKNEEIHQSKLQFFTGVSHEFRTPLTLIIDPLEKLISENLEKETIKQYYVLMHRNAKQLHLLINQLLDFRKLESGRLTLKKQQSDIVSFVRTIAASFEARAKDRKIHFRTLSSVSQLMVNFDSAKLNMVLNNLLSNAFKFTPILGEIIINIDIATTGSNVVVIKVCDTGVGIPKEEQEKIFDIFYQSAHSTSLQEGSGIGLALTKELVQLHGGQITVESEVGRGSCLSIFLPISEEEIEESKTQHEAFSIGEKIPFAKSDQPSDDSSDLPLLLVVDDNADIRNYIELNFNKTYRIIMATNGSEGFQQATEFIPDLVVSDIMMPGTNGLELCRLLKSDERTSHIPVILLTARQSDESKKEGYETGADAYVTKPFSTIVLQSQIQNLLEQRQRLRELFSHGSDIELKKIAINITDEAFLKKVTKLVEENLDNENFEINTLAEKLKMSRSQFYRKIKALTNKSPHDFVTTLRMNKALEYLLSGQYNISETAFMVGFSHANNFSRTFIKHFGSNPSKYIETLKKK